MFAPGYGRAPTRPAKRGPKKTGRRSMSTVKRRKKRSSRKSKQKRFVKGSPAAKRFMAKLRKMQKKKRA
jgi:hypothetical protein